MNSLRSNFCRPYYCGPALQYSYVQGKKKLIESKNGIKVWQTTNSHRLYSAPGVDIPIKKYRKNFESFHCPAAVPYYPFLFSCVIFYSFIRFCLFFFAHFLVF
ncbi:Uncharacterized protein APZ42_030291 [Daphnia magna]|uniref:Uncharacterized protein n=1 Tax=Daphnia magna TaxID=35525 RepID=A0A164NWA8_9CRUS|nr:Uncharacterized protein APZ42_030291 [Daphnia magna]